MLIAIALACRPRLLIADEPTTALDVSIQAQILRLLKQYQRDNHMAMIFVSHDLGTVAGLADEIAVMYAGRIVERGPAAEVLAAPRMPYTEGLLRSIPRLDAPSHGRLEAIRGRPRSNRTAERLRVSRALPVRTGALCRRDASAGNGRTRLRLLVSTSGAASH